MNRTALIRASVIGTGLQLAMIIAGHFIPFIKDNLFAIVGMLISLIAGLLYARAAGGTLVDSLIGGAIAGGVCALIGIVASFALGDVPAMVIAFGTLSSVVTGGIGGAIGKAVTKA
ncbi:MAG: hypothetical protein GC145_04255 [Caulobacter sp.]|nr:hypothetical protein [Caulobacter sp.]